MAITSLYSVSKNEWKNTTSLDVRRLHEQNPAHLLTKSNGKLPLHCAVPCAAYEVIRDLLLLCTKSAEVREDTQNWTPLHLAVHLGRADIVPLLLSVYSPAAKLSDVDGHTPLDIAEAREKDADNLNQGNARIIEMLKNIDGTIKKYMEESGGSRKLALDRDGDITGTNRLEDGRIMTKDGKILRKTNILNRKAVVCIILHPLSGQNELSLIQNIQEKFSFTSHTMKDVLEANREILSNKSMEKMLVKELVPDNDAISTFKAFYKKVIKFPGGMITGFPLTLSQIDSMMDPNLKINCKGVCVIDKSMVAGQNEDHKSNTKLEIFESTKKYLREHENALKSLGTPVLQVDCDRESNDIMIKKIMEAMGPTHEQDIAAQKLQANARGFLVRNRLKRSRRLVVMCQARWRGRRVRYKLKIAKELEQKHEEHSFFIPWVEAFEEGTTLCKKLKAVFRRNRDMPVNEAKRKWLNIANACNESFGFQESLNNEERFDRFVSSNFHRRNKRDDIVFNAQEFIAFLNKNGAQVHDLRFQQANRLLSRVLLLEFASRKTDIRKIFEANMDVSGELAIENFHVAFIDSAKAWGYDISNITSPADELKIFEDMKSKNRDKVTWPEFHDHMYELAHGESKRHADKIIKRSQDLDREKRKHEARKHRESIDKLVEYETDSGDERELNTDTTPTEKGPKKAPNSTRLSPAMPKTVRRGGEESTQPIVLDENTDYSEKQMLISIFRKYRQGLHRLFMFYSKGNMGAYAGRSFDQISKEHSGVNMTMFRLMVKDLGLVTEKRLKYKIEAARKRYEREGKVGEMPFEQYVNESRPYTTLEVVEKCFLENSTHLKAVSSVSKGKGILSKPQFTMALARVAVKVLDAFPWKERYLESWRRVDAVFGRLDLNNISELNKRLRGKGGFCKGDGDTTGHVGSVPTSPKLSLSYPLRLPGDPPTPPPSPISNKSHPGSNISVANLPKNRKQKRFSRNKILDGDGLPPAQRQSNRMTISLAAEFGIDDTTYDFNNPRESFYGSNGSNSIVLDSLNLSYGVEEVRKNTSNAGEVNVNYTHKGLPPPPSATYFQDAIQSTAGSGRPYARRDYQGSNKTEYDPYATNDMNNNPNAAMSNFGAKDQYSFSNYKTLRKFDDDNVWSMSWNELENDFEPKHEKSFNEQAHIRRREEERTKYERIKFKRPPMNSSRRHGNRISPRHKRLVSDPQGKSKIESHAVRRNKNQAVPSLASSMTARSSRTPGRHISREQFNSMKSPQRSRPRKRGVGHERSTFGGRRGIASPENPQRRGLRGFRN